MKYTIIGDVHGKISQYEKIITEANKQNTLTIQIGDFGFKKEHLWHIANINDNHKILFGNHDDYSFLYHPHSLNDFKIIKGDYKTLLTVRGAHSIDKNLRIENRDWWANEELTYQQFQEAIELYEKEKPEIMVTHDCPQEVREKLFNIHEKSITSNGLQAMFEIHQPELWIFGHHHKTIDTTINNTQFVCLNELETFYLNF